MSKQIELLDCTLRDGAYITGSYFGVSAIKGIIKNMQNAGVEILECGWLKDAPYKEGTSYYHVPDDIIPYMADKKHDVTYVAMIDYNRYDTENLPEYDGRSIDAIRVVFPHGHHEEGISIGRRIREKGYKVFFQAANTLAYSEEDLIALAKCMNEFKPVSVSIVDTFGAMFEDDLDRIVSILDNRLDPEIKLGFHSHNNQQLAFSLAMHFVEKVTRGNRGCIVDSTLCGMGRGAGNATTELVASYLNRRQHGCYDMNVIMDAIDKYMQEFQEKYTWGYSTAYFIAGMYQCHVNNIAYLQKSHRTNSRDMRNIIKSLTVEQRRQYDYDILEEKYMENQSRHVDDEAGVSFLKEDLSNRTVLLLCPGNSLNLEKTRIKGYIDEHSPVVVGVGALLPYYSYDYVFFSNHARYEYAREVYADKAESVKKILLSNIKTEAEENEIIINFDSVVKRGWKYFDNPAICCMRLMGWLGVKVLKIAGFDTFGPRYNESYADASLPSVSTEDYAEINRELKLMYRDFNDTYGAKMNIEFLTDSEFADNCV
ncbi:MAG: aldolase catalytic domain-containing protein [Lachnospiraceae bacterium]|nr:aldolase catalytic domain-containing protein [Lachnospiraceae bacterium]